MACSGRVSTEIDKSTSTRILVDRLHQALDEFKDEVDSYIVINDLGFGMVVAINIEERYTLVKEAFYQLEAELERQ